MGALSGPPVLHDGRLVGKCRIVRFLKRGGMGEVYLAEHLALERPVALKVLPPDRVSEERIERFLKEARLCSQVEHPNVVVIHDVDEHEGLHYIVMQYIQGKNLAELVEENGGRPLPWRSAVRIAQLAAKGLHAVHARGLVHRDVKPSNIMLSNESRVVLMDFGLVREEAPGADLTVHGHVVGTPWFMSPEQCRGEKLGYSSDIFSLGSTLYFLLAGNAPFPEATAGEAIAQICAGKRPVPLAQRNPQVPREVEAAVAKAMAPRAADRYSDAAAMAADLKALLRASPQFETHSQDTVTLGADRHTPSSAVELPQAELLPLETTWETLQRRLPWVGAIGGAVSCLLLVALIAYLLWPQCSPPPQPPAPPGMVYVEAGHARLGNDEAQLRKFLSEFFREPMLGRIVKNCTEEGRARVHVPAFFIDKYEVTDAEYAKFVKATGRAPPEHWRRNEPPPGKEDHPAVNVTYDDAEAYARWAGKVLPTREQWMRAFRGDDDRLFPWGNEYTAARANVRDNPKYPSTSPVGDTPRDVGPFGVCNMVGNAREFIRGWYVNPDDNKNVRVCKGADFESYGYRAGIGSYQCLVAPKATDQGLGFRCAMEIPSEKTSP